MPPKTGNRKLAGAKNTSQKTIEALEEIEERNPTATAKADDAKPALDGIKSPPNGVDPGNPDPKGKRDSKHIFEGLGDLMDINFNKNASLPTNVFKTAHPEGGPKLTQEEILKQKMKARRLGTETSSHLTSSTHFRINRGDTSTSSKWEPHESTKSPRKSMANKNANTLRKQHKSQVISTPGHGKKARVSHSDILGGVSHLLKVRKSPMSIIPKLNLHPRPLHPSKTSKRLPTEDKLKLDYSQSQDSIDPLEKATPASKIRSEKIVKMPKLTKSAQNSKNPNLQQEVNNSIDTIDTTFGKENLKIGKENLKIGKENLTIGKENLTIVEENLTIVEESEIYELYDFIYPGEHISKLAKFLKPAEAELGDVQGSLGKFGDFEKPRPVILLAGARESGRTNVYVSIARVGNFLGVKIGSVEVRCGGCGFGDGDWD